MHKDPRIRNLPRWAFPWGLFLLVGFVGLTGLLFPDFFNLKLWATITKQDGQPDIVQTDLSSIIRNLGLIIFSIIALCLAAWRSWVANQQSATAIEQVDIANKQYSLAERGHATDRFQKAVQMLNEKGGFESMAGLLILEGVAKDNAEGFAKEILEIICAYSIRRSIREHELPQRESDDLEEGQPETFFDPPMDLEKALRLIPVIRELAQNLNSQDDKFYPKLKNLDLSNYRIHDLNLNSTLLISCNFSNTQLTNLSLKRAYLGRCNFKNAFLDLCDLTDAEVSLSHFEKADLFDTNISGLRRWQLRQSKNGGTIGLSQEQINNCWAWEDKPPIGLGRGRTNFSMKDLVPPSSRDTYEKEQKFGIPTDFPG